MPEELGLDDIRGLIERGAQIVDVLPEAEYQDERIAGAVSIPLKKMSREAVSILDPNRPVIVYCHDYQ